MRIISFLGKRYLIICLLVKGRVNPIFFILLPLKFTFCLLLGGLANPVYSFLPQYKQGGKTNGRTFKW